MEDDLKKIENGRQPKQICLTQLERRPQKKWKTTSEKEMKDNLKKMEDDFKKN
jgi:hypothetical protein